jgi:8-oxo-dGTP pyrophosphatase MutT (NUDIX family)
MNFHRIKEILSNQHTLLPHEWKGAVLFLCNEDYVFLIKRSEVMPTHSGQIAFVGGHRHVNEDDPWIVAQREFEEETNHSREVIEFLGILPMVMTARLQPIVPVMAKLKTPTDQFLKEIQSNGEWDDVIAYPWSHLLEEESWDFAWRHGEVKSPVMFHSIRPGTYLPLESNSKPHILWGATATMIWSFLKLYYYKPE